MKTKTKKLILTAKGEINKGVINMINNCTFKDGKIYTGYYLGSGRFTSAHSAESTITSILDAQGYKFTLGNDAPKDGIKGNFVKCSAVAIKFIQSL